MSGLGFCLAEKKRPAEGLPSLGLDPMLASRSTGLAAILPKTLESCLADAPVLLYNWNQKLRELIIGITLSRSLLLQSIAQTRPGNVKTHENLLSGFLSQPRLEIAAAYAAYVRSVLKRIKRRRLWKHAGKAVVIIDSTAHAKARSRRKMRPMPGVGKVRVHNLPTKETVLVPGYQEIWMGLLLSDKTVLPLKRKLWSENGKEPASLNLTEEAAIRQACDLVRETFKIDIILVADSGFRRKDLLHDLKRIEKIDFVIRLQGKLNVRAGCVHGLLQNIARRWPKRVLMQWRESGKHPLLSRVAARRVAADDSSGAAFSFNALFVTHENETMDPMFLATTLTIAMSTDLMAIVRLYSYRWGIETFFWMFKNGLQARTWRVFSCWEAIDRLLTAAHMAYLLLMLIAEFCQKGVTRAARSLMRRIEEVLRTRFARPPEFTFGRFLQILAMDFPSPCWPQGALL